MDQIAHQLTKYSLWLLPIAWLVLGGISFTSSKLAGALFVLGGACGILWNLMFMYVDSGRTPQQFWSAVTMIPYADAPLGHVLSVYLPLISKLSVVAGVAILVFRRS